MTEKKPAIFVGVPSDSESEVNNDETKTNEEK